MKTSLKQAKRLSEEYEKEKYLSNHRESYQRNLHWTKRSKNLLDEKELLSAQFMELTQKFQALLDKLENQLNDFLNGKNADKNKIRSEFLTFKDELNKRTEKLIHDIRAEHKNEIETLRTDWENKKQSTNNLKIKKEGIKHLQVL